MKNVIDRLIVKLEFLKARKASMVIEINDKEKEYLEKVKENPKQWNNKSLNLENILSEASLMAANLNLDFSTSDRLLSQQPEPQEESSLQHVASNTQIFPGPFNPNGFEIVGEITSYQQFELNFEMKIDKLVLKGGTRISLGRGQVTDKLLVTTVTGFNSVQKRNPSLVLDRMVRF